MKWGKVCDKHPELGGLRTNSHSCAGCKSESDKKRRQTENGKLVNQRIAKKYSNNLLSLVLAHYGCACSRCGFDNADALTIDHIDQNGAKHRREVLGGSGGRRIHKWLIDNKFPPGFRVLCQNCNTIVYREHLRRIDNGYAI